MRVNRSLVAPIVIAICFALLAGTALAGCGGGGATRTGPLKFKAWKDPDGTVEMRIPEEWASNGGTKNGAWISESESNAKTPDKFVASVPTLFISKIADVPKEAVKSVKPKTILEGSAKAIYKEPSITGAKQGPVEESTLPVGKIATTVFDAKTKDGTAVKIRLTIILSTKPARVLLVMMTTGADKWSTDQGTFDKILESVAVQ